MHEIRSFLQLAARHLDQPIQSRLALNATGASEAAKLSSWSTFTRFDDLGYNAQYFSGELPKISKLTPEYLQDCAWGGLGPIRYDEIAHVLIPRFFTQEIWLPGDGGKAADSERSWNEWEHEQDIDGLSVHLQRAQISHNLLPDVLELKRF